MNKQLSIERTGAAVFLGIHLNKLKKAIDIMWAYPTQFKNIVEIKVIRVRGGWPIIETIRGWKDI